MDWEADVRYTMRRRAERYDPHVAARFWRRLALCGWLTAGGLAVAVASLVAGWWVKL